MSLYPLHLNIGGKLCVIVGGGAVAERKVGALLDAQARVRVVSPEISPRLAEWAASGQIETVLLPYAPDQLNGVFLAFAATNDFAVNARVIADAQERRILCNSANNPKTADFVTTGTLRRGDLLLSVSAGGNPALTAQIIRELETYYTEEYAPFVELLGQMRDDMKALIRAVPTRRRALAALVDARAELLMLLRNGDAHAAHERAKTIVETAIFGMMSDE